MIFAVQIANARDYNDYKVLCLKPGDTNYDRKESHKMQ